MGSTQSRAISHEKYKKGYKELQGISAHPFSNLPKIFELFSTSKKIQKKAESDPKLSLIVRFYNYDSVFLQCDSLLPLVRRGYSPLVTLTPELRKSLHDLKQDLLVTRALDQSKGCQFVSFENEIKASFAIDGLPLNENRLEKAGEVWLSLTEIVRDSVQDIDILINAWVSLHNALLDALEDPSKKYNQPRLTGLRTDGIEVAYGPKSNPRHYGAYGKDVHSLFCRLLESIIELSKDTNNLQAEQKFVLTALTGWQLGVIHPFLELNGVIGRLFTIWALRYTRSVRSPSQLFISSEILNSAKLREEYDDSFISSRISYLSQYVEPSKMAGLYFSYRADAPVTKYEYECPNLTDAAVFVTKLFDSILKTVIEYEKINKN